MQKLFLSVLCLCLLLASSVSAQRVKYEDRVLQNAAASAVNGNAITVNQSNTVRLDVVISNTATVAFEISGPLAAAWYSKSCISGDGTTAVTETTTSGVFYCSVAGGQAMRTPISSFTSGTVTVVARATTAF